MQTVELFAGTESFSNVARQLGHATFTVEIDPQFSPDLRADVATLTAAALPPAIDVLWASPPCQGFSVAVIGRNWNRDYSPKSDSARHAMALVRHTMRVVDEVQPALWFIENPRGMLRKLPFFGDWVAARGGVMRTVTYCQYGDTRQKPTDIWTNCLAWQPRPICRPGSSCHEPAPRGSRTGTQGIVGARDRSRIPAPLFEDIFHYVRGH